MNTYLNSVINGVKQKYAHQPEFCQTVEEVLSCDQNMVAA